MLNNTLIKHGQTMYVLGLTYAIGIIKIYGDRALQELEQKLKQEQADLDKMENKLKEWKKEG